MSNIYTRNRERYGQRSTMESSDIDRLAESFTEWMTGAYAESYALKVSEYCKTMKNCVNCQFYNGTCRLRDFPFNWDAKDCF